MASRRTKPSAQEDDTASNPESAGYKLRSSDKTDTRAQEERPETLSELFSEHSEIEELRRRLSKMNDDLDRKDAEMHYLERKNKDLEEDIRQKDKECRNKEYELDSLCTKFGEPQRRSTCNYTTSHRLLFDSPIGTKTESVVDRSLQMPLYHGKKEEDTKSHHFVKWTLQFNREKNTLGTFINYFNIHADLNDYSDNQKCQQLLRSFGLDAIRLTQRLGSKYDFRRLVEVLFEYYEPAESKSSKQMRFQSLVRKATETPREFPNRIQDLASTAFHTMSPDEVDEMVIARFVEGHDLNARIQLLARQYTTLTWL